jgi:hypothetical protein
MPRQPPLATLSRLAASAHGVFRGQVAVEFGVTRNQLAALAATGVIERLHPDTYRMTAVVRSSEQSLKAALLWAGDRALAAGRSAGEAYELEGVRALLPEIVVPRDVRLRSDSVIVHRGHRRAQRARRFHGVPVTGVEPTLVALAHLLDGESFENACEDARRRRLTSVSALRAYLGVHGARRPGAAPLRRLLDELDPVHPARSLLEVKTRRLLVANGLTDFTREFPAGVEWPHISLRLRIRTPAHDSRNERASVARRPGRLRTRQREVERPRSARLPGRVRNVGKGDPPSPTGAQ